MAEEDKKEGSLVIFFSWKINLLSIKRVPSPYYKLIDSCMPVIIVFSGIKPFFMQYYKNISKLIEYWEPGT